MATEVAPRAQRVGGVEVAPGRAAVVSIGLDEATAVGAWVAVGRAPGPRVTVVANLHGCEVASTLAARALIAELDPAALTGTLVVVPVLRPGNRFTRPGRVVPALPLPGDAGGKRRGRLAFALYSDLVVGAEAVIVLGSPLPGRRCLLYARVCPDDTRARALAVASGARAIVPAADGSLVAVAGQARRTTIGLVAGGDSGVGSAGQILLAACRRALAIVLPGLVGRVGRASGAPGTVVHDLVRVLAPADGVLVETVEPGALVGKGHVLARIEGPLPGRAVAVRAPARGLVLEAPDRPVTRKGAVLFLVGAVRDAKNPKAARPGPPAEAKLRVGWLESISLPDLGLGRVPAKIDTGARTSALHVIASRTVGTAPGPSRRPILELTLAVGGSSRRRLRVRVPVKEFIEVRDTSGRTERRPVIETTLELGPLRKRIRVTLTDRGDMRCPMLVGRTALGHEVVVDPLAHHLLG